MSSLKKMMLALLVFAGLVLLMLYTNFDDLQISKYPSMDEVKEDMAIQKGWIPTIIPDSAYDIAETHDLDSNTLFGSFNYKEKDEAGFLGHLTPVEDANDTAQWGNFLFKVNTTDNKVQYRNKPGI